MRGSPGDLLDPDADAGILLLELGHQVLEHLAFPAECPEPQCDAFAVALALLAT
jgi:hypothetical protein